MAVKNSPTAELWGWLIPGLGLLGVALLISVRTGHAAGLVIGLIGLGLCLWGAVRHERGKAQGE